MARFAVWRQRPQRIRDAGWYAFLIHILLSAWLGACYFGLNYYQWLSGQAYEDTVYEVFRALITMHVPMIFIGWMTLRGRGWAIWLGAAFSVPCFVMPFLAVTGVLPAFTAFYENGEYHAFVGYAIVSILMLVQLVLYVFALAAHRRAMRR